MLKKETFLLSETVDNNHLCINNKKRVLMLVNFLYFFMKKNLGQEVITQPKVSLLCFDGKTMNI